MWSCDCHTTPQEMKINRSAATVLAVMQSKKSAVSPDTRHSCTQRLAARAQV